MKQRTLKIVNLLLTLSLVLQYVSIQPFMRDWHGHLIHEKINATVLTVLVLVHVFLNLRWIVNSYLRRKQRDASAT
jgi:hypothetical protein